MNLLDALKLGRNFKSKKKKFLFADKHFLRKSACARTVKITLNLARKKNGYKKRPVSWCIKMKKKVFFLFVLSHLFSSFLTFLSVLF